MKIERKHERKEHLQIKNQYSQSKTRPSPVVNKFPQNQHTFQKLIPGPTSYSDTDKP